MTDFRLLADRYAADLAADLAAGRRRPGERLPPSRDYAHRQGIAPSTASRVYAELVRRGVAVGEVGRGTFLRSTALTGTAQGTTQGTTEGTPGSAAHGAAPGATSTLGVAFGSPLGAAPLPALPAREVAGSSVVDLEVNFCVLPDQAPLLTPALRQLAEPQALTEALQRADTRGTPEARAAAALLLARGGWQPEPERILFAGRGHQALATVFTGLVAPGERIGFEAVTYSMARSMAPRLGLQTVPVAMDEHGMRPDALRAAHRAHPLKLVYVQTALHNPLGMTMPAARRAELAAMLRELDLIAVEDAVYAFLEEEESPPLAALAPERVVMVDSLSKRVAPGVTLGFLVVPPALRHRLAPALRLGGWMASGIALACSTLWMQGGQVAELVTRKRAHARARNALARRILAGEGGLSLRGGPNAYHLWLELPRPWRAETFVAAAARRRIAVSPAAEFAVGPGHAPDAVRLALAAPEDAALRDALETLRDLALAGPEAGGVE
ncbi:PLP-dependent aminotransferase family protein [Roseomonas sp. GC11]|uniref:aminotransferase-like domain-containing protein n=1 Tax=Roseomonas sp. GC11 TaxID=2950546 RepID=UPI00210EF06A|nr:PLP-dependent aminotransferase family protein [Roseomonas sp. GC11]MCQ4161093.1 PLP-dependent aminotransferase family protein [Roseomonas sp. GC11]